MVKKMKLPFLVKKSEMRSPSSPWAWPSCHQPRTLSFRANNTDLFNSNINSDSTAVEVDPIETLVRSLQSNRRRLFFEPDETSSILETKASTGGRVPFKDSLVLSMESRDPYVDFRKSMEEMVEAHALNHLEALQELLCWYLRVNSKSNHASILAAFVDLLVGFASVPSSSPSPSPFSPLSFSSSSLASSFGTRCVNYSSLEAGEEVGATDPASTLASLSQVKGDIIDHHDEASSSNA
ncbi:transcription repressor OFP15-like [Prosopis cineraria]|uniref:transcription repressor OFP15-like n=1 Tax=Prosopis cineraria TaxID=364024 RepID=UPI002410B220|nr:transcription repressor OFP15-like [Prosopis cineraria]XP_054776170.1 transcription repressor OFP15-like [Prosopis cineraria]